MTRTPRRLLLGALLATSSAIALAQTPPPPVAATPAAGEAAAHGKHHGRMDPAQRQQRMAEHRARRLAELKAQLKLVPAQEGAWTAYTAAMQPPANAQRRGPRMDRAEFDKLTTPQRIDRMEQFAAERQAQMKQRGDAVKAFYAQLTPEQQKLYDDRAMRGGKGKRGGPGHHGMGRR